MEICKYGKNDIVYLNEKVGVIITGSVFVRTHSYDMMKPRLLFKAVEGGILGHSDTDNGVTNDAQTWILVQEHTEIAFFKKNCFNKLWIAQKLQTGSQIILAKVQQNIFFKHLSI